MSNIAIIPARSGSKGLKDKNIKELCGKPLLAYSILAAIDSRMFDAVMVSTDSEVYAEISKEYGAEVPFLRSAHLSSDAASSWEVVLEVINSYEKIGKTFDTFMLLQPTSPLRTVTDIKKAYAEMSERKANAIVSVCEADHSPLFCNALPDDHSLVGFIDNNNRKRRQELKTFYRFNGAIYLSRTDYFLENNDIFRDKCYAYVMEKENSIDIDDEYDFIIAKALIEKEKEKRQRIGLKGI